MPASLSVFNTSNLDLDLSINMGPSFTVPAASRPSFAPGSPRGSQPTLDRTPTPGTFGWGHNQIQASVGGSPIQVTVETGQQRGPVGSGQLYLFWDGQTLRWNFLADGQLLASG